MAKWVSPKEKANHCKTIIKQSKHLLIICIAVIILNLFDIGFDVNAQQSHYKQRMTNTNHRNDECALNLKNKSTKF